MITWDRREPVKTPEGLYHATSYCVEAPDIICAAFGHTPEQAVQKREREERYMQSFVDPLAPEGR